MRQGRQFASLDDGDRKTCGRRGSQHLADGPRKGQFRLARSTFAQDLIDAHVHVHRPVGDAFVVPSRRRNIGIVAAHGDLHVAFVRLPRMGRVERAPADVGKEHLRLGVARLRARRAEIPAHVERRDLQRPAHADEHVGEVLAGADARRQGIAHGRRGMRGPGV